MHEIAMNIGYAVLNFFGSMDGTNILNSLYIMGVGMLGIFIVTGVIIAVISLLKKIFS